MFVVKCIYNNGKCIISLGLQLLPVLVVRMLRVSVPELRLSDVMSGLVKWMYICVMSQLNLGVLTYTSTHCDACMYMYCICTMWSIA